jgi:L-ascorbate metabolism protein UlaG (beta-lactamase superfamily)
MAAKQGRPEVMAKLLPKIKQIDAAETDFGRTALHWAALKGYPVIVKQLLAAGANPKIKDKSGNSAIDYANRYGHSDVAVLFGGTLPQPGKVIKVAATPLQTLFGKGEAEIWYTGHSGWAVKTQNHLLIFDYWAGSILPSKPSLQNGRITAEQIKNQNVYVFISHNHSDHFDPAILEWKNVGAKVKYVFGFDTKKSQQADAEKWAGADLVNIPAHQQASVDDLKISTLASTDTGVGFLVTVDGMNIFHAGDHANLNSDTQEIYDKEIQGLASQTQGVDIAFLPVSGCPSRWSRDYVIKGFIQAINAFKPQLVFPMHGMEREFDYLVFSKGVQKQGLKSKVFCAENPGDHTHYKNGITTASVVAPVK